MALQSDPSRHKNMKKIFVLHKKCMRLLTFSNDHEHTSPIFKFLKNLKLQDIIKFSILKLIYFYFNDQLQLQVKNIFIKNTRGGKLLFISHINTTHFGTKSLRYNGPLTLFCFVLFCFVILFNVGHNTKVAHIYLHI